MKRRCVVLFVIGLAFAACATSRADEAAPSTQPPEKVDEVLPEAMVLPSGDALVLDGGLTDAGRERLAEGETGYFVLAFAEPPDDDAREELIKAGIQLGDVLDYLVYMATVAPEALPLLEEETARGTLRWAGPLPAAAKLAAELAAELAAIDADERISVVVHLAAAPTDEERADLMRWLEIRDEAPGPVYLVDGNIKSGDIGELLAMPLVRRVEKVELATSGD
jgi:hypothetical protein